MTDEKKKQIQMTIIIAGFALAITISAISFDWFGGGGGGKAGPQWLICINEDCGAQYELSSKEFRKQLTENNPMGMMPGGPMAGPPSLICKECGEQSAYIAEKCDKCGEVYLPDNTAETYADIVRCPECGFSKYEDMMADE